jgi:hypothetical protein
MFEQPVAVTIARTPEVVESEQYPDDTSEAPASLQTELNLDDPSGSGFVLKYATESGPRKQPPG